MSATRVGRTLGNFRILECLGTGGAGMIWKAEDLSLGRVVALKALRPELAADSDMAVRFRAEARTLAKLSHPSIASLYSLIEDEEGLFLVLEYVEGNTLAALLATSGPLPFDSALALLPLRVIARDNFQICTPFWMHASVALARALNGAAESMCNSSRPHGTSGR